MNGLFSLLSGTPQDANALVPFDTTCLTSSINFLYNRNRLVYRYISGILVTALIVGLGCITVARSGGQGETMKFSRVVDASLDLKERLAEVEGEGKVVGITRETRVQVDDIPGRGLGPAPPVSRSPKVWQLSANSDVHRHSGRCDFSLFEHHLRRRDDSSTFINPRSDTSTVPECGISIIIRCAFTAPIFHGHGTVGLLRCIAVARRGKNDRDYGLS